MLYISREEVAQLLTYEDCLGLVEEALALKGKGEAEDVPRLHMETGHTNVMFLPSMIKSKNLVGMRIYNVGGAPVRLMYIVWDGRDGRALAMMDAMWIRDIRTGSVGAISAKYLARPDSQSVAVIGSGRQARSGLLAHAQVFNIKRCRIFSPSKEHREDFAKEVGEAAGLEIEPAASPEAAVKGADIVITGTGVNVPSEPAFRGAWLEPGMHVSSIGGRAELDDEAVTRPDRVIIDSKAQFPYECHDVTQQVNKGLISWDQVLELHDVIAGNQPQRENANEITLVKTVGTPLQDLLPAAHVYKLAAERKVGKELGDLFPPSGGWYSTYE